MEKHKLAESDYNEGMKYKDIAAKYDVSLNTVKSWQRRHNWNRDKDALKEKGVHTKLRGGAPTGNKFAIGNDGGAPAGNQNAKTHGLFSKFFNDEANEIIGLIAEQSPQDIIWHQIEIQYAAIIRAQQIMWVESKDDLTKQLKKEKYETRGNANVGYEQFVTEQDYELQFAWDKQANFLNAQSRAMGELRSLIKQFIDIADPFDERKKRLEMMGAQIDKLEADTNKDDDAGQTTVIVSNTDQMQAYIDAQATKEGDGNGESPDSSSDS